jgi:DNA-binding GntR family transcriptional regulator
MAFLPAFRYRRNGQAFRSHSRESLPQGRAWLHPLRFFSSAAGAFSDCRIADNMFRSGSVEGNTMEACEFGPIADTTRRAEIVTLLRRAILTGRMKPGQKLNELRISEQMHVSRAPLREAVRELVQEGLLTGIPYAGTFVTAVTAKDIEDAYGLNKVLDEFALTSVWPKRDERFFAELDRRHDATRASSRQGDTAGQIQNALRLHGLIYEWADNSMLLETWQRLANRLQMYFALHQRARNEPVPDEELHERYVRLLKGNDLRAAQRHTREHIDSNFEELIAYARGLEIGAPEMKPVFRGR